MIWGRDYNTKLNGQKQQYSKECSHSSIEKEQIKEGVIAIQITKISKIKSSLLVLREREDQMHSHQTWVSANTLKLWEISYE